LKLKQDLPCRASDERTRKHEIHSAVLQ